MKTLRSKYSYGLNNRARNEGINKTLGLLFPSIREVQLEMHGLEQN